jgi:hypothetical protein
VISLVMALFPSIVVATRFLHANRYPLRPKTL